MPTSAREERRQRSKGESTRLAARVVAPSAQSGVLPPGFTASVDSGVSSVDLDQGAPYLAGFFAQVMQSWAPQISLPELSQFGFAVGMTDIDANGNVVKIIGAFEVVSGQSRLGFANVDSIAGAVTSWAPALGTPPSAASAAHSQNRTSRWSPVHAPNSPTNC